MDSLLSIEELVRELDQPNLIDWKFFSQSPDLIVYRRVNQVCCCRKSEISIEWIILILENHFLQMFHSFS